jgi:hypothetical protein
MKEEIGKGDVRLSQAGGRIKVDLVDGAATAAAAKTARAKPPKAVQPVSASGKKTRR